MCKVKEVQVRKPWYNKIVRKIYEEKQKRKENHINSDIQMTCMDQPQLFMLGSPEKYTYI